MVHSVNVVSAVSCDASGSASRCPSSPARRTSTGLASTRGAALRQATSDGSTALTDVTSAG